MQNIIPEIDLDKIKEEQIRDNCTIMILNEDGVYRIAIPLEEE